MDPQTPRPDVGPRVHRLRKGPRATRRGAPAPLWRALRRRADVLEIVDVKWRRDRSCDPPPRGIGPRGGVVPSGAGQGVRAVPDPSGLRAPVTGRVEAEAPGGRVRPPVRPGTSGGPSGPRRETAVSQGPVGLRAIYNLSPADNPPGPQ